VASFERTWLPNLDIFHDLVLVGHRLDILADLLARSVKGRPLRLSGERKNSLAVSLERSGKGEGAALERTLCAKEREYT
jgi:hypothetical protein